MDAKPCVIVVPVYSATLRDFEAASFRQTIRIFGNKRDISLLTYIELDLTAYKEIAKSEGQTFSCIYFNKKYFADVDSYSKLCLQRFLYKAYSKYEYMLICQLDAWTFSDKLDDWMEKGWDYVGAPLYLKDKSGHPLPIMALVGNGGYSLRCIKRFIDILDPLYIFKVLKASRMIIKKGGIKRYVKTIIRHFLLVYYPEGWKKIEEFSEDIAFCSRLRGTEMELNVPDLEESLKFSFDDLPSHSFELAGRTLPMGCHAFQKNEWDTFWSNYIHYKE